MSVIVIADDDTDIRELVVFRLERDGHDVRAFSTGQALLDALTERGGDVAVLDVMMPGLTGLETAQAIRSDAALSDTPIILMTGRTSPADIEAANAAGVDDYVTKPFSPRDLSECITRVLERG